MVKRKPEPLGMVAARILVVNGKALTPTQRLSLVFLSDYFNEETGYAWPSVARLAALVNVKDRQMRKIIGELEHLGLIRRLAGPDGGANRGGYWQSSMNHYVMDREKLEALAMPKDWPLAKLPEDMPKWRKTRVDPCPTEQGLDDANESVTRTVTNCDTPVLQDRDPCRTEPNPCRTEPDRCPIEPETPVLQDSRSIKDPLREALGDAPGETLAVSATAAASKNPEEQVELRRIAEVFEEIAGVKMNAALEYGLRSILRGEDADHLISDMRDPETVKRRAPTSGFFKALIKQRRRLAS